ncbi:hypothetical protein D3C86_2110150 [compost metagenome]
MRINPPGKYITAGGVDDVGARRFQIQPDSGHNPVLNQDISLISVRCGNDNAIFDDLLHLKPPPLPNMSRSSR